MSVIDHLARVLDVEIVELTGQPYRHDRPGLDSGHAGIPALRLAVQRARMPRFTPGTPPRLVTQLRAEVERAEALRQAAVFDQLGNILPNLLDDVVTAHRQAPDGGHDELALLVVRTAHIARVTADLTGHHDLAWTAVELELQAAEQAGAPAALAAATWDLCGVWLHSSALAEARTAALSGLDQLEPYVGRDPELTELAGALHLRAAVTYSRLWSEADVRVHMAAAQQIAPEVGNAWQTQFNQANVGIHALETAVELGRPTDALGLAERVPMDAVNSRERQTHYWTCRARGLGMNGRVGEALESLLRAEHIAAAHVHNRPMARELVIDLLHRDRRSDARLRSLARRMGLA